MALKILYSMDIREDFNYDWQKFSQDTIILENEYYLEKKGRYSEETVKDVAGYDLNSLTKDLLKVAVENLANLDHMIIQTSENWSLDRISVIDKNILRLGIAELLYLKDIPNNVTINEYIEIARCFGTDDSPKFINGILDKIIHLDKS